MQQIKEDVKQIKEDRQQIKEDGYQIKEDKQHIVEDRGDISLEKGFWRFPVRRELSTTGRLQSIVARKKTCVARC